MTKYRDYYARQQEMVDLTTKFVAESLATDYDRRPSFRKHCLQVWSTTGIKPEYVQKVLTLLAVAVDDDRVVKA